MPAETDPAYGLKVLVGVSIAVTVLVVVMRVVGRARILKRSLMWDDCKFAQYFTYIEPFLRAHQFLNLRFRDDREGCNQLLILSVLVRFIVYRYSELRTPHATIMAKG